MQDKLYNIALRPVAETINTRFVSAAQKFSAIQDQYLLGPGLPHVTLNFFRALDDTAALQVFSSWPEARSSPFSVVLAKFCVSSKEYDAKLAWWVAINTELPPELAALQKSCSDHINAAGHVAKNQPEEYQPHFTLARTNALVADQGNPAGLEVGLIISCQLEVGEASEAGMFMRSLLGRTKQDNCEPTP